MNHTLQKIPALVREELEAANREHPAFVDWHQAWAVLKEEVEEAANDLRGIDLQMEWLWGKVKKQDCEKAAPEINAKNLYDRAVHLAAEAIQVAAMAQKAAALAEDEAGPE